MFSFIKKYAESISGIDIYPNIALAIFLAVFAGMIWFALRADKKYISELEQIPLEDTNNL
jgi:cytochrome c oxidase cbb3-type subunit 3